MRLAADLCTLLRLLLAPVFAWMLLRPAPGLALVVYGVAVVTDVLDGRLARASGSDVPTGRLFDHGADAFFLFPGLWVLAMAGRVPTLLPLAAMTAFTLYCLDGRRHADAGTAVVLRPSRSGAVAGVMNYAVVGAVVLAAWWGPSAVDQVLYAAALAVAAVNAAAAVERTSALLARRAPSPAR